MKAAASENKWNRLSKTRYLYLLPAFFIYVSVVIYPAIYSLYLSFFSWNGLAQTKTYVGLWNYFDLFTTDAVFRMALRNNLVWLLLTICITVTLALAMALLINMPFKGRTVVRGVLYFPYIMSGVMVAITWQWIYHPQLGLLNSFLGAIGLSGLKTAVLSKTGSAFIAIFIAGCWHFVGGPIVLFLAGLQTIPKEMVEAAQIDGANGTQTLLRIKLPLLRETLLVVLATQIINSMKVYDIIYAMTGGGPAQSTQTLSTWMVTQTFSYSNIGAGTAIAWIMVLIMLVIVVPYVAYTAKN